MQGKFYEVQIFLVHCTFVPFLDQQREIVKALIFIDFVEGVVKKYFFSESKYYLFSADP